ncbi:MAG: hypothetical protein ACR2OE_03020 [Thermomicrobiales bacterium]
MRRTAGIVVSMVIVVAILAGFAIGRMAGGSSEPSSRIGAETGGIAERPAATQEVPYPSLGLASPGVTGSTPERAAAAPKVSATPLSTPRTGVPDGTATPGSSPIETLKP